MKHSIANYPTRFLCCVVSPTKICIQFEDVQSKLRFKDGASYVKLPDTTKALPISTTGTEVDILAVGCQMPTIVQLQMELLHAYERYSDQYKERYAQEYGIEFRSFLEELRDGLTALLARTDR